MHLFGHFLLYIHVYIILCVGKIDYKPKEFTLTFMKLSANQTECSEISIIQDGLDEPTEFFELMLSIDNGNNVIDRKKVSISACRNGGMSVYIYIV